MRFIQNTLLIFYGWKIYIIRRELHVQNGKQQRQRAQSTKLTAPTTAAQSTENLQRQPTTAAPAPNGSTMFEEAENQ